MNMEAPIADMMKYKNGALRILKGLYATLSTSTARMAAQMAAPRKAMAKGQLNNVKKKKPK
jgi:hypothetical protein